MPQKRDLNPNWFLQLLGFKSGSISVDKKGITLHKNGKRNCIDNYSLIKKGQVSKSWIGSSIVFDTLEGKVKLGPVSASL